MILLTGITGNIGGATARALLARGEHFRALVRDPVKAAAWAEQGVDIVQGDLEDPAAVRRALAGVDRALLVMPNGEFQERVEVSFVRAAREAGLPWIMKLSSPEAVRGTTSPIPLAHIAAEDAIRASGMSWTFVRPSFYMQNFRGSVKSARATGKLSMPTIWKALARCAAVTCMLLLIILGAKIFGYFFALTRVTHDIVTYVAALDVSRWTIIVLIFLLYFILGFFMDQIAILVLTVPVALPVVQALGFDPVWFGVIVIVLAEVGLVTPPMGLNVFVVSKYTGRPVGEVFLGVTPHVVAHIIVVAILIVFPQIILWLPSSMGRP